MARWRHLRLRHYLRMLWHPGRRTTSSATWNIDCGSSSRANDTQREGRWLTIIRPADLKAEAAQRRIPGVPLRREIFSTTSGDFADEAH
jgi:hypothetical protein